jgi:DNA primase
VQQITAPALRLMLQQRLAEMSGVARSELDGLMPVKQAPPKPAAPPPRASRKPPSLTRKLLQLLLFQPGLAAGFDVALMSEGAGEERALVELLGLLARHPEINATAMVLEHFRNAPHEALMSQVAGEILQWDQEFEAEAEFAGALELLARAPTLSSAEKQELTRLLQSGQGLAKTGQAGLN